MHIFKTKPLLTVVLVTAIILFGVHLFAFSVLYPNLKIQLSKFILNSWLLGTCIVITIYSSSWLQAFSTKVEKYFYKLLYTMFYSYQDPCLLLNKNLNITFCNNSAQKNFSTYDKQIRKHLSTFRFSKLAAGNLNFDELCSNTKIKNILANMRQSTYASQANYGTLKLTFKIKKIEILGLCLGFIARIKFESKQIKEDQYQYDSFLLENIRLKMLNLMLDDSSAKNHSEYLNLYNNINNIINIKKAPTQEFSRNHL